MLNHVPIPPSLPCLSSFIPNPLHLFLYPSPHMSHRGGGQCSIKSLAVGVDSILITRREKAGGTRREALSAEHRSRRSDEGRGERGREDCRWTPLLRDSPSSPSKGDNLSYRITTRGGGVCPQLRYPSHCHNMTSLSLSPSKSFVGSISTILTVFSVLQVADCVFLSHLRISRPPACLLL